MRNKWSKTRHSTIAVAQHGPTKANNTKMCNRTTNENRKEQDNVLYENHHKLGRSSELNIFDLFGGVNYNCDMNVSSGTNPTRSYISPGGYSSCVSPITLIPSTELRIPGEHLLVPRTGKDDAQIHPPLWQEEANTVIHNAAVPLATGGKLTAWSFPCQPLVADGSSFQTCMSVPAFSHQNSSEPDFHAMSTHTDTKMWYCAMLSQSRTQSSMFAINSSYQSFSDDAVCSNDVSKQVVLRSSDPSNLSVSANKELTFPVDNSFSCIGPVQSSSLHRRSGVLPVLQDSNLSIMDTSDMCVTEIIHPQQVTVMVKDTCFFSCSADEDSVKKDSDKNIAKRACQVNANESMLPVPEEQNQNVMVLPYYEPVSDQGNWSNSFNAFDAGNNNNCSAIVTQPNFTDNHLQKQPDRSYPVGDVSLNLCKANRSTLQDIVTECAPTTSLADTLSEQGDMSLTTVGDNFMDIYDFGVSSIVEVDSTEELSPTATVLPDVLSVASSREYQIGNGRLNSVSTDNKDNKKTLFNFDQGMLPFYKIDPTAMLKSGSSKKRKKNSNAGTYQRKQKSKAKQMKTQASSKNEKESVTESGNSSSHRLFASHENFCTTSTHLKPATLLHHAKLDAHLKQNPMKNENKSDLDNNCIIRNAIVEDNNAVRLQDSNKRRDDYFHIRSPEKYTDCMLSSSVLSNDNESSEELRKSHSSISQVEAGLNGSLLEDNEKPIAPLDFTPLDPCSPETDGECQLFGGSLVVEPMANLKRSLSNPHTPLNDESAIATSPKRRKMKEDDMSYSEGTTSTQNLHAQIQKKDHEHPTEDLLTSDQQSASLRQFTNSRQTKKMCQAVQDTFSMLTSMTNSILFQKDMCESLGMQEFLRDYTEVRIGQCIKCNFKSPVSTQPSLKKTPETLNELLITVFKFGKCLPIYRTFIQTIKDRLKSMEKEITDHENVIKCNNLDVMKTIRFDSEQESLRMRNEVENLAKRCRILAKACWKASRSRLHKGVTNLTRKAVNKHLQPILFQLRAFGNVRSLCQKASHELKEESSEISERLSDFEKHLPLPSIDQVKEFRTNEEEISNLIKESEDLCAKQIQNAKENKKWSKQMVRLQERIEKMQSDQHVMCLEHKRKKQVKKDRVVSIKRFILWNVLPVSSETSKKCFGFLGNSVHLHVCISSDDPTVVTSFQISENLNEISDANSDICKFLTTLIKHSLEKSQKKCPCKLTEVLAFASRSAASAKILWKEINKISSSYNHCGVKIFENFIMVDFFSSKPHLCNFQVRFNFAQDPKNDTMSPTFYPLSFAYVDTPCFGKFTEIEVMETLNQVPIQKYGYFSNLAEAVFCLMERP
ncbi:uncharacterized protein LOC143446007 isoform X2 [Clavelina lepadiformis]|uniref:uncharacterized protein LOC143446007 isoform X2 n=1 Tax=Clavelina lepadiformis TaxID=159417 RepID=UPI004042CE73